jgi:cob(I)alamin adenosyltransferase
MPIYTKTGDAGDTGLFGGGRVGKDHPRVVAYGEVDELNSAIGVVRATPPVEFFDELFESVQRDLFAIGGQLAAPDPAKVAKALEKAGLSEERVARFERIIDQADAELTPLRVWFISLERVRSPLSSWCTSIAFPTCSLPWPDWPISATAPGT